MSAPSCHVVTVEEIRMFSTLYKGRYTHHTFYYVDPLDGRVWFGKLPMKDEHEIPSIDEINQNLKYMEDDKVYPKNPGSLRVAPALAEEPEIFIKRPYFAGLDEHGNSYITREFLHEAFILEKISGHPNIVNYHGCRFQRGYITGIVLERLEKTLMDSGPDDIEDVTGFMTKLQETVDYLHSIGLAHNNINPYNVMIKNKQPILIDFGSCAPVGSPLDSSATEGWHETFFQYSQENRDAYGMKELRLWFENRTKAPEVIRTLFDEQPKA